MLSSSSFSRKDRKGQFFVLSAVAVVTILFFVGRWTGPSTQIDTSSIVLLDEFSTFDNIQQKTSDVIKGSESCEDLAYNLQEYKNFIGNFARDKNYKISFEYSVPSCGASATVNVYLTVASENVNAQKAFTVNWP